VLAEIILRRILAVAPSRIEAALVCHLRQTGSVQMRPTLSNDRCKYRRLDMFGKLCLAASFVGIAIYSTTAASLGKGLSNPVALQITSEQKPKSTATTAGSTRLAQTSAEQPVKKQKPKAKRPGRLPAVGRPPVAARPPVARPPIAGRPPVRPPVAVRPPVRPPVIVTHPPAWRGARWGAVVAGVTLGTIIVVAANTPPPPPSPDLCWTWTNAARTHGYWYYCSGP